MSVEKKVPEVRFEEFCGEWEKKAFGDCFVDIPNNTLSRADLNYKTGLAQNIHYGDILIKFGEVLDACNEPLPFITNNDVANKLKHAALRDGDIIIADAAEDSIVGKCTELFNIDEQLILSGLHTIAVRPTLSFASKYLGYYLNSSSFHDQLLSLMQGTKVLSISKTAIRNTNVTFPRSSEEQAQIGNYFQKLDALINQHQQKHGKLSSIKKAMLEKMFPKQGETIPEIRFKGFSGEWKEKALNRITEKVTEKNTFLLYCETFTNSAEFGIISQRDYFDKDISNSNNISGYYVVQPDDFVYNPRISTLAPCGPINRNVLDRAGIMSPLYTVFRTKGVSTIFIEYFFQTKLWHTFMFLNGDTGARADRFSIKDSVFFELPLLIPTVDEQTKIGSYFQMLDSLINQHQQQITKLNNIKQACLSKMFV